MLASSRVDFQIVGVGRDVRKGENSLYTKLVRGLHAGFRKMTSVESGFVYVCL